MFPTEEIFKIEPDFEVKEDWEKGILDSYRIVLESKVNHFCGALDTIRREFAEKYEVTPEKMLPAKIDEQDIIGWRMVVCDALQDFYGWGGVSLTDFEQTLRALSFRGKSWLGRAVRRCINWLLNTLIPFFKSFASHLRVQSWSIGGSGGFPAGISVSISVAFEP